MTHLKEALFHQILDDIHDGVVTLDNEWRVTYLNSAAAQFAGRPAEDLIGKSTWDIFPQAAGNVFYNELHGAASDRRQRHFSAYCPGIDRWLEADVHPSTEGMVVITRDITRAKKQARDREERLRLALSFGKMGVWECDLKTRVVRWSPEMEALHGLVAGSFDGRPETVLSMVHPEDRAALSMAFWGSVKEQGSLANKFRVIWPDGSEHFVYARGKVISDDQGEPATILGITVDITEQKRAAHELQRKLEQMRVLSSLAAAVNLAREPAEIYHAAIQGLIHAVGADRASILLFDPDDVIRFKAWTGLSDEYREVCAGHTPWRRGTPDAQPIAVPDVLEDPSLTSLWPALAKEEIRAVAFIPLMGHGGVIGKFMLYYNAPHEFRTEELQVAQTIATHVGFATERRQADVALRASEERFRATFFQAAVGITEANVSGELRLVNDRFCGILGYSRTELLGKSVLEITHPDHRQACLDGIHGLLTGESSSYSTEKRYLRKNGTSVWVRVNVSLVRDQNDQPQYFIGVVEDITERIQAERALRESEQRLTLALSAARLEVWDCDLREKSVEVSPAYAARRGSPRSGGEWFELIHPDDQEHVRALVAESVAGKRDWAAEFRVLQPDGSIRWIHSQGAAQFDDSGEAARLVGVSLDVTGRKQAETALRESEELFRNLADTAPVMMWMSGPDKLCTFFNKTWMNFTGRTLEQELGHGWAEGIYRDDLDDCFTRYCAAFDARRDFHIEYRLRRADGEYRWLMCSGVPRFTSDGAFAGYIGSDIDITDLKRAQVEAVERQKLESLGVLTSGIAHDFNNLLGSVLADAELAELEVAAGSSPAEQIGRIKGVAVRASEIVRELMIYSGQDQADLGSVDLSRLVEEMLELLKVSISKHAVLKTDLRQNLPAVRGNAAQIRQVVMNLIINASEALGEKDGTIHVTTSLAGSGRNLNSLSTNSVPKGDYLRLEVSDTGCGIAKEQQARVFDPFFSTKFAGRGLGLAVVHGIVRAHAGAIHLSSTPGQGTTFQVLLPFAARGPARNVAVSVPDLATGTNVAPATLLFVEDEAELRTSVSKMLSRRGFSVLGAGDGTTAVDLLRSHPSEIDIILLDMTLPGTPSREVIEEAQRMRPGVKVVLTSAYSRERVAQSIDAPIVKGFIRKPFQFSELMELLRATLEGQ
jgi:two-component system, cell cycle sensor histidine kinase and response regulator CckA